MRFLAVLLAVAMAVPTTSRCEEALGLPGTDGHVGRRYMVLQPARIHAAPSASSRIVADQPRAHLVYAEPTADAGWLRVRELGVGVYPDRFQHLSFGAVPTADGKFVYPKDLEDTGFYKPIDGYIEATSLSPPFAENPIPMPAGVPVPQLWAKAGISDPRQFPVDPMAKPFGSVVMVETIFRDPKTSKSIVGECSGFLIGDRKTVGTAGHCFSSGAEEGFGTGRIAVGLSNADGTLTWVGATLTAWANKDSYISQFNGVVSGAGQDWAVLHLDEAASAAHEPLLLPTPGAWTASGSINMAVVGFGADLNRVVVKQYPKPSPSPVQLFDWLRQNWKASDAFLTSSNRRFIQPRRLQWSSCNLTMSDVKLIGTGDDTYLQLKKPPGGCVEGPGNSGGPILFWDQGSSGFRLLSIVSTGADCHPDLDRAGRQLYDRIIADNRKTYGAIDSSDSRVENGIYAYRAALSPYCAAVEGDASRYTLRHLLDQAFVDAVNSATGQPPARLASLLDGPTAMQSDDRIQPRTGLDHDYLLEALRARVLRDGADVLNPAYQIPVTLGETIHGSTLAHRPCQVFVHLQAGIPPRTFFAPEREKEDFRSIIASIDAAPGSEEAKDEQQQYDAAFTTANRYVVVGGDMFEVKWPSGRVVGIFRNLADPLPDRAGHYRYDPADDLPAQSDVRATDTLSKVFAGPTPADIPGGSVISPRLVWEMIAGRHGPKPLVISAFDAALAIPTAYTMEFAAAPGTFDDAVQTRLAATLARMGATPEQPVIVYCHHDECWMSYNLALRLIHLGYKHVHWLRSGWQGWVDTGYLPITWARVLPAEAAAR